MIEPTAEMIAAFDQAVDRYHGRPYRPFQAEVMRDALAAVLAIVERDYTIRPRRKPSSDRAPEPVVHQLTPGDEFVHCCGRRLAYVYGEHATLNPHAVTCRGPS